MVYTNVIIIGEHSGYFEHGVTGEGQVSIKCLPIDGEPEEYAGYHCCDRLIVFGEPTEPARRVLEASGAEFL